VWADTKGLQLPTPTVIAAAVIAVQVGSSGRGFIAGASLRDTPTAGSLIEKMHHPWSWI